jgi:hypothetical protein
MRASQRVRKPEGRKEAECAGCTSGCCTADRP